MDIDFTAMIAALILKFPVAFYVVTGLAILIIIAQIYVFLTPRKDDDEWVAALEAKPIIGDLLRALVKFAPFKRK